MTVQELCDELTILAHSGYAQAQVKHISGELVKNVAKIEMVGEEIVLIRSEE